MKCKICGVNLSEDAKFCSQCGAKIMKCSSCGAILEESARFCYQCGAKVGAPKQESSLRTEEPKIEEPKIRENSGAEKKPVKVKYNTYFNTAASYMWCFMNPRTKKNVYPEPTIWEKNNIIEYKDKIFFFSNKYRMMFENYEDETIIGSYDEPYVLGSVDPLTGEKQVYKEFTEEENAIVKEYCWLENSFFTIKDDKIYYINRDWASNKHLLKSIDIVTKEENVVCERLKGLGDWVYSPIIGEEGEILYLATKISHTGEIEVYIMDYQKNSQKKIDCLLGYNENYVYYTKGKQTIQLEISSFTEKKFSEVFTSAGEQNSSFVDCSTDIVFYKEDAKADFLNTRLLGYDFSNTLVDKFEIPNISKLDYEDAMIVFAGNRYVLMNFTGKTEKSDDPAGIAAYGMDGNEIGHIWEPKDSVLHVGIQFNITKNYVFNIWGYLSDGYPMARYIYCVHLGEKKSQDSPQFKKMYRFGH